jgi:hypothetical protein
MPKILELIFSGFEDELLILRFDLLSGKLGTKSGSVNMRREEKQSNDYD